MCRVWMAAYESWHILRDHVWASVVFVIVPIQRCELLNEIRFIVLKVRRKRECVSDRVSELMSPWVNKGVSESVSRVTVYGHLYSRNPDMRRPWRPRQMRVPIMPKANHVIVRSLITWLWASGNILWHALMSIVWIRVMWSKFLNVYFRYN